MGSATNLAGVRWGKGGSCKLRARWIEVGMAPDQTRLGNIGILDVRCTVCT